jgi:hypothetical protein
MFDRIPSDTVPSSLSTRCFPQRRSRSSNINNNNAGWFFGAKIASTASISRRLTVASNISSSVGKVHTKASKTIRKTAKKSSSSSTTTNPSHQLSKNSKNTNGGSNTRSTCSGRIPKSLQAVFLSSNRGNDVHQPPPKQVASKIFLRRWITNNETSSTSEIDDSMTSTTNRMNHIHYMDKAWYGNSSETVNGAQYVDDTDKDDDDEYKSLDYAKNRSMIEASYSKRDKKTKTKAKAKTIQPTSATSATTTGNLSRKDFEKKVRCTVSFVVVQKRFSFPILTIFPISNPGFIFV